MKKYNFVASVDDLHLDHIEEIVKEMEHKGFHIEKVREITGTISGSVDNAITIQNTQIKGVTIEGERTYYPY